MINLDKFKNYKKYLEENITNRAFRSRMMFEAIEDESFADIVLNYLKLLNNDISSQDLESMLTEIRKNTIKYFEESKKDIDLNDKVNHMLRSLAFFYLLECIDEHSKFSDDVIEQIKQKYPNDYLDVISNIDKMYLSLDTKKQIKNSKAAIEFSDDVLKKYIILKKWQDLQHNFFENGFGDYRKKLQELYCSNTSLSSFDLEQHTLRKRLFDSLNSKKILDLDTCSIISELYIKKFVVKYIGGKMYGLSVLNSKGIKVPYTMVIPVGITVTKDDLSVFENKNMNFSCRSSADIEDGKKNSFAGMFDSYLNVPFKNLMDNIEKVKNSINNERLKEYIRVNNLEEPHMAVVIQSFKEPTKAGVWIGNSDDSGVLEWVKGNGEKLVSGTSTPNSEIWKDGKCENPLMIKGKAIGESMIEYQRKVENNADFEWMILDEELIMLQYRPVTQKVIIDDSYSANQTDGYSGIPAAPGLVEGEPRYLESPNEQIVPNKILLAMMTDPDWLPHLMNSKGAVTAYGGFLCHTAIVCRELGIPCVTGVGEDALDELSKEESGYIRVNGNSGNVEILKRRNTQI